MFFHNLKYELITLLKTKDIVIWIIIFPVFLSSFFKIAFSNVYKDFLFSEITAAVVENTENPAFRAVADEIEKSDEPFIKFVYCDEKKAEQMLQNDDIGGIIYSDEKLSLSVHNSDMTATVLASFVEQYNSRIQIITHAAENDPTALPEIISAFSEGEVSVEQIPLTDGNPDTLVQYYYSLIAMVALYGSLIGMRISINNQANLSAIASRKGCSPTPKIISLAANLTAGCIVQTFSMLLCVSFIVFVLNINMGGDLLLIYLSAVLGGIFGVSFGFAIGTNSFSENLKSAICIGSTMLSCYFSGLYSDHIKIMLENKAPWVNSINPATIISDCFYCLNVYSGYDHYLVRIVKMSAASAVLITLGFIFSRRKKYAYL